MFDGMASEEIAGSLNLPFIDPLIGSIENIVRTRFKRLLKSFEFYCFVSDWCEPVASCLLNDVAILEAGGRHTYRLFYSQNRLVVCIQEFPGTLVVI